MLVSPQFSCTFSSSLRCISVQYETHDHQWTFSDQISTVFFILLSFSRNRISEGLLQSIILVPVCECHLLPYIHCFSPSTVVSVFVFRIRRIKARTSFPLYFHDTFQHFSPTAQLFHYSISSFLDCDLLPFGVCSQTHTLASKFC